jgi:hypothetical protein
VPWYFWGGFWRFSGLILQNTFMVFLGSSCGETAKNVIKKKSKGKGDRKKVFVFSTFWPKVFDMDFPQKVFNGVFELPLLRNAQKRHTNYLSKIKKEKEGTMVPYFVAICQTYVAFTYFFLRRPLTCPPCSMSAGLGAHSPPVACLL